MWTSAEEAALISIIHNHTADVGSDGLNPTAAVWSAAAEEIKKRTTVTRGRSPKALHMKFERLLDTFNVIDELKNRSRFGWDTHRGANIVIGTESEMAWRDYVKAHPKAATFRAKGWVHYDAMKALLSSVANASGRHENAMARDINHAGDNGETSSSSSDIGVLGDAAHEGLECLPALSPLSSQILGKRKLRSSSSIEQSIRSASTGSFLLSELSSERDRLTWPIVLDGLVSELAKFNKTLELSLAQQRQKIEQDRWRLSAPPTLGDADVRKGAAQRRAEELEIWLDDQQQIALMDIFRGDVGMADQYLTIQKESLRKLWVRTRLGAIGFVFD